HSYDHRSERRAVPGLRTLERVARVLLRPGVPFERQLACCRTLDYRIKGYRPPRSRIGPGLCDRNLVFYNFEWLASGSHSIGTDSPRMEDGVVKLTMRFDAFALARPA